MYKLALLLSLLFLTSNAHNCDLNTQIFYHDICVLKSCLQNKLSRLTLVPTTPPNIGTLSNGITYSAIESSVGGTHLAVSVQYNDEIANQFVSDPTNCLNWRIYQTVSSTDLTRKYVGTPGAVPSWPLSTYSFTSNAEIKFNILISELESRNCEKFVNVGFTQYRCYFELAFVLASQTEASYYFEVRAKINTGLQSNELTPIDFLRIVQKKPCLTSGCKVQVYVEASLLFCEEPECIHTSTTPFVPLYIGHIVYLKHLIDDPAFQHYYLNIPVLHFATVTNDVEFRLSEITNTVHVPGHNIYILTVPVVEEDVHVYADGRLFLTGSRILQEEDVSTPPQPEVVHLVSTMADMGQVRNAPTSQKETSVQDLHSSEVDNVTITSQSASFSDMLLTFIVSLLIFNI